MTSYWYAIVCEIGGQTPVLSASYYLSATPDQEYVNCGPNFLGGSLCILKHMAGMFASNNFCHPRKGSRTSLNEVLNKLFDVWNLYHNHLFCLHQMCCGWRVDNFLTCFNTGQRPLPCRAQSPGRSPFEDKGERPFSRLLPSIAGCAALLTAGVTRLQPFILYMVLNTCKHCC